ncbi:MAG: hypothetical protein JW837_15620 [Sedimentisphaerales bacterium]|nr:hypothetical protein [Sedimentisphaerales bacterium]
MLIKKLCVRLLIAFILGLCTGIVMELATEGFVFPVFLIVGLLACIFIEVVIEFIRYGRMITRDNLRKIKKPALRILIATSIGLLAGIVLEFAAVWHLFPFFFISAVLLGITVGITIEIIRYRRLMKKAFLEGKELNLDKLLAGTAELIRQIIKKMRYRREVRYDVMAELAAHFEDELKDCRTDEDKQKKARQLIDDFGDTKLLAILFRRAKIRCRPLWRTVLARTFQTAGVLIVCFIIYAVWFSTGKPTISVDYLALFNKMNKPEVRDEDNAWPHYEKAIALYIEPDQRIQELTEHRRNESEKRLSFSDFTEEKQNKIKDWLKENKSNWDNLEISQKQLIEKCFREGFVPLADGFMGEYSSKLYRVFDEAVEFIINRIEHGEPDYPSYYGGMMEMDMMYRYGLFQGSQREIELDPDIAFDSEVISSFGKYSLEELKNIKKGIDAGLISRWIDNPPVPAESLFGILLSFEKKLILKWIEDNESAWQQFKTGSLKSYCYREYQYHDENKDQFLWSISLSHLQQIRRLVRLGIWRSRVTVEQGNLQQSMDDCLAITRAGNHWRDRGTIVEQLAGLLIRRFAYNELLPVLATQRLSADELKKLQLQLSQFYPQGYPLVNIEGEKIAFMDTVQRLFTAGGPGGGHLIPQKTEMVGDMYDNITEIAEDVPVGRKFVENATLTSLCLLHARRDATVEFGERIYARQAEITGMSPYQRHTRHLIGTEEMMMKMPRYRYALLYHLMPAAERISELSYQSRVLHEAIITILAVQRWQLDNGDYPENLDELIEADYLKELPMDPYGNKPLIYKKTENNFILYSLGCNFEDDGGIVFVEHENIQKWGTSKQGDAVFWPVVNSW